MSLVVEKVMTCFLLRLFLLCSPHQSQRCWCQSMCHLLMRDICAPVSSHSFRKSSFGCSSLNILPQRRVEVSSSVYMWEPWLVLAHSSNHGQFSLKKLCAKGIRCEEIFGRYCMSLESGCHLEYNASSPISCVCPDFLHLPYFLPKQFSCVDLHIPGITDFNAIFDRFTCIIY